MTTTLLKPAAVALLAGLVACSSSNANTSAHMDAGGVSDTGAATDDAGDDSGDAGAEIDIPSETADTATRGTSATSLASIKAVSELFVQEDPTIDPTKTAGQNADAIAAQLASKLQGDGGGCASGQITHTTGSITVSVVFGTGCTVPSLDLTLSGAASATVAEAAGTVTIGFTFTNLDVNGLTLNGTASEATSNGTSYTSKVALTEGTNHVTFDGTAALDANDQGVTLNGTGTYQEGAAPSITFDATGVHHTFGACYADAGTLAFEKSFPTKRDGSTMVTETLAFSSTTPSTGQAQATIEGVTSTVTLPTYGTCPHS